MGAATVRLRSLGFGTAAAATGGSAGSPTRHDSATSHPGGQGIGSNPAGTIRGNMVRKASLVAITGSASYATGGETISAAQWQSVGFDSIDHVEFLNLAGPLTNDAFVPAYDYANSKVKILRCAGVDLALVDTTAAVNVSAMTVLARVTGT